MKIDKSAIRKLEHLARIEIDPAHEADLIKDMEQIVTWVQKLDELDTSGVDPLTHMSFEKNVFRADVADNKLTREEALKNAPERSEEFFRVPKVLD